MLSSQDFIYLQLNRAIIEQFIDNDIVQSLHNLPISENKIKKYTILGISKKKYSSLKNLPQYLKDLNKDMEYSVIFEEREYFYY